MTMTEFVEHTIIMSLQSNEANTHIGKLETFSTKIKENGAYEK